MTTNKNLRTSVEMEKQSIQAALNVKQQFKGTVVWEKVSCGKRGCKCQNGALHGPFPYLHYWSEGKVKRKYLPKEVGRLVACPKTELEQRLLEIEGLSQEGQNLEISFKEAAKIHRNLRW